MLKGHEPIRRMVYQSHRAKVRALFVRDNLPPREAIIGNRIRSAGLDAPGRRAGLVPLLPLA